MSDPSWDSNYEDVLRQYPPPCRPEEVVYLGGAGGFSGACFWRLTTALGQLCLRRWPKAHPSREKLEFIHNVLRHVYHTGFRAVPLPLDTVAGVSYVEQGGHLWELSPWISGEADYCRESTGEKLVSAAQSLASFHRAASTFAPSLRSPAPAPGLERRLRQLLGLQQGGVQRLRQSIRRDRWPELYDRAVTMLDLFEALADSVAATLRHACRLAVPLQPCIHDIWHDHVLYEGSRVSGFVDFGAMDFDSVAGDIARLFGSLVGDIATGWETAMSAYESERPLSADERALVGVFDRSAVLLSGMNWFWWIYVDRREFQARDTIIGRLDVTIERLRNLSQKAK